jgi:hypothetical protein
VKPLIDECLSTELVDLACQRGHVQAAHVVHRGLGGTKDWDLMPMIIAEDWTLVTRNAYDFRGPTNKPGSKGLYARQALHAGLICLNGPPDGFDLDTQRELFEVALDDIDARGELVNEVLEVSLGSGDDAEITLQRYPLP